jgi:RNA polymerase sigma-70 factor (ECF subfamily)
MATHPSVSRTLQLIPNTNPNTSTPRTTHKAKWRVRLLDVQHTTPSRTGLESKPVRQEPETSQRAVAVDPEALSALFARQKGKLYQSAFSVLRNKQDAEDALQDGLLSAYLHLASFEGKSQLSTWVTRIVINAALMNRRKLVKDPRRSGIAEGVAPSDDWPLEGVDRHPGPEQAYAVLELKDLMAREMSQLTPALQLAFRLRHVENLSVRKAASAAGVTVTAMKARAFRAHQQLRRLLVAKGISSSKGRAQLFGRLCRAGGSEHISVTKGQ